ncbi:pectinesterase family protein [Parapedobacter tibetensis]|uniref:pectinesterase family protein n=1 Tax=Parapedobacter tibetensis TaxID=2972951 RepID=UPI00214D3691|nr:pectinesterase family protein [Parapedobacter tibetensis]
MGAHIRPEGWHNWNNPDNEGTAYYAEYQSTGLGYQEGKRVSWSSQLTQADLGQYTYG